MTSTHLRALRAAIIALVALGLTFLAAPAQASSPLTPQAPFGPDTLPAGVACEFPLTMSGVGGATTTRTKGSVVIKAGFGYALTLTNADNPAKSMTTRSAPFAEVTKTVDGVRYVEALGSNLIILFPTDVPAGPSTTLYNGRVTYTIDVNEVWTIRSTAGRSTDVCAALR